MEQVIEYPGSGLYFIEGAQLSDFQLVTLESEYACKVGADGKIAISPNWEEHREKMLENYETRHIVFLVDEIVRLRRLVGE